MQGKREREHMLGLGHTMEDGGCPIGPTGMGSEEWGLRNGVWRRNMGAQPNMGSGVGALLE